MAGVSLQCGDCGTLLKSVEEAQEHAELTKHTNFRESTEPVLNLVCSSCGKPCRSKTETDLHRKRTGHSEFVDKTAEAAKPISLESAPTNSVDVNMVDAVDGEGTLYSNLIVSCRWLIEFSVVFGKNLCFLLFRSEVIDLQMLLFCFWWHRMLSILVE